MVGNEPGFEIKLANAYGRSGCPDVIALCTEQLMDSGPHIYEYLHESCSIAVAQSNEKSRENMSLG